MVVNEVEDMMQRHKVTIGTYVSRKISIFLCDGMTFGRIGHVREGSGRDLICNEAYAEGRSAIWPRQHVPVRLQVLPFL